VFVVTIGVIIWYSWMERRRNALVSGTTASSISTMSLKRCCHCSPSQHSKDGQCKRSSHFLNHPNQGCYSQKVANVIARSIGRTTDHSSMEAIH